MYDFIRPQMLDQRYKNKIPIFKSERTKIERVVVAILNVPPVKNINKSLKTSCRDY